MQQSEAHQLITTDKEYLIDNYNDFISHIETHEDVALLEKLINVHIDERITSLLHIVVKNLKCTKIVVQCDFITRNDLLFIYNELVYLDVIEEKRIKIIEILSLIIEKYSEMDKIIKFNNDIKNAGGTERSKLNDSKDVDILEKIQQNELKDLKSKLTSLNISSKEENEIINDSRITSDHHNTVDKNNSNVLSAKIWGEFKLFTTPLIIPYITRIINSTGFFYSNRMQKSNFLNIFEMKFVEKEILSDFIIAVNNNFTLQKDNFKKIYEFVKNNGFFNEDIVKSMLRQDKFFLYYLAFVEERNHSIERIIKVNFVI